jgi:hypothetical protein
MFSGEASIEISAPAEVIYDLVADVTSTGERSPECRRVEWIGAPGAAVGARFRGRNQWRGFVWWRRATIVHADRGHEFVFRTEPARFIYHDSTEWRYRLAPASDGTVRVTESYEVDAPRWIRAMDSVLGRRNALQEGMRRTLVALKESAEQLA